MTRKLRFLMITTLLLVPLSGLFAADITIPELQLITRGMWSDEADSVLLNTRGISEIEIAGGYKFGGSMSFGFESGNIDYAGENPPNYLDDEYQSIISKEDANSAYLEDLSDYMDKRTSVDFLGAEVQYRNFGGEGTHLSYFVGQNDRIATGEDFTERFGTLPFATKYQGYYYFPEHHYRGLHRVKGTGLSFTSGFGSERHASTIYLYQDSHQGLDPGTYSSDYRSQFSFEKLQLEYFAGTTFPMSDYNIYRTGLLFFYRPSERGDFFAQVGIPRWDPTTRLKINHFYFLFEPRVHFDPVSVIFTLFWHPEYYNMVETDELGTADIHFNLRIGKPMENPVVGGLETTLELNTDDVNQDLGFITSPYIQAVAGGVIWNFSVNLNWVPYDAESLVEGVVGIKAEF